MGDFWQKKKVLAFIALKHHTRFITPIMEYLKKMGAETQYVIAQGENPQELTAMELGLQYIHIFDCLAPEHFGDVANNYHLLKTAISKSLQKDWALSNNPITITDRSLLASAKEYVGFRNLIQQENPDLCIALHELNRWGKILGFWAKKYHIPFITLQEGLYYGKDIGLVGHVQFSTINLVWGETTRRKLSQFEAPTDRIISVGNTHLAQQIELLEKNDVRGKKRSDYHCENSVVVLLLMHPVPPPMKECMPLFEVLSKDNKIRLFLKWHPVTKRQIINQWLNRIPKAFRKKIVTIHGEDDPYALMAMSDVCVLTEPSTTGLEALAIGKPLVQLEFSEPPDMTYSFVEKGAAIPMTPSDFAKALEKKADLNTLMDRKAVKAYLKEELYATKGVVERIEKIARNLIEARNPTIIPPRRQQTKPTMEWTLFVPVHLNPSVFMTQMQAIAAHSQDQGTYEVVLLEPENVSGDLLAVIESLGGDIMRVKVSGHRHLLHIFNATAEKARGEFFLFFSSGAIAPMENWLSGLREGIATYGTTRLFGGRIENLQGGLVHAGMVLNPNHAPVSAYKHLPPDFPGALKERPFQLLNYFLAVGRNRFFDVGGFWEKAGKYALMDFCLRAQEQTGDQDIAIYLPRVHFLQLADDEASPDETGAISYYGRWHGTLWESEEEFYAKDGITKAELQVALMKRLTALAKGS